MTPQLRAFTPTVAAAVEVRAWAPALAVVVMIAVMTTVVLVLRGRDRLSSPEAAATYRTLHAASTAARHLREGLTAESAGRAAKDLRPLLGVDAVAIGDGRGVLAWEGAAEHHRDGFAAHIAQVLTDGRTVRLSHRQVSCDDPDCLLDAAILAPVVSDGHVVAVMASYHRSASSDLLRATEALADWVATQIDLAELARERGRTAEAELRALRAQISPHFIYNSLGAIASFIRTDPERARELVLEFADFTRYSFRRSGPLTPLADELVNIERYLALEEARFGDRMQVTLRVAPEVLGVRVPSFAIQPLVENAVQHGIEARPGVGTITIEALDAGTSAEIVIEDDGVGADPERIRAVLAGDERSDHVGMSNVDARLRRTFGDEFGLVVETAPGAGTRVSFRVPKSHPDGAH